jgi:hypothetical protein
MKNIISIDGIGTIQDKAVVKDNNVSKWVLAEFHTIRGKLKWNICEIPSMTVIDTVDTEELSETLDLNNYKISPTLWNEDFGKIPRRKS